MRIFLIISIIFTLSCAKGNNFKVLADCDNCTLVINAENGDLTFNINGPFKKTFRSNSIQVNLTPKIGTTGTVEVFKSGDLCNSEYGYIGEEYKSKTIFCD